MSKRVKVVVDYDLCEANGICMDRAPKVFELNDEDNLSVLIETPGGDLLDSVRAAAAGCPKGAIALVEIDD